MRLFVGYGYHPHDKWVEDLVFPLAEALGCEVVHGKVLHGDALGPQVKELLLDCDAMIGFTTRREMAEGRWTTHRWVVEELATAFGKMPVVEVQEEDVDPQLGMLVGNQRVQYKESERDRCLVEIAQAISHIRQQVSQTMFRLEPQEFTEQFRALINKKGLDCSYRVMRRNIESAFRSTNLRSLSGGLSIYIDGLRPGDFVQICVSYGKQSWSSDYEPIDAIRIGLTREV